MNGNRKVWTGVLAGVLAAGLLLTVAGGAYRAGQRGDVVTRVVGSADGDGDVVRVIERDRHGGPGFLLFPLLGIGLVLLLVSRGRRDGYGGGWCGPGPGSGGGWGPEARMAEWHQRAHQDGPPASTPSSAPSTPTAPTG